MAMQMELALDNGIILSEAYLIISKMVFVYSDTNSVEVHVSVYKDQTAFSNNKPEVLVFKHLCTGTTFDSYFSQTVMNVEDKNHLDNAYMWLLNLSEYSTAVEV
jgi:hypothetical protein